MAETAEIFASYRTDLGRFDVAPLGHQAALRPTIPAQEMIHLSKPVPIFCILGVEPGCFLEPVPSLLQLGSNCVKTETSVITFEISAIIVSPLFQFAASEPIAALCSIHPQSQRLFKLDYGSVPFVLCLIRPPQPIVGL